VVATLVEMLDEVRAGRPLEAVAAALPGPFDRRTGALVNPPGLSGDWHRLNLAAPLRDRFGCRVVLENDANCAALAEATEGRPDLAIYAHPVTEAGRVELLPFLHEQAISITAHRFGTANHLSDALI
jgi:RHH-type proline utilization regulon transcriptional repressor/proline dehydrogenase/delta 1-pyrroline-5-carboxylate dehydrogenase